MSYVKADILYEQLDFMKRTGHDLSDYIVDGCDECGGEAFILPKRDEDNE